MRSMRTLLAALTIAAFLGADAFAQPRRSRVIGKANPALRKAFAEVSEQANKATVRVKSGEKNASLGVVVDAQGFILTKASELKGALKCELHDGTEVAAKLVGVHTDTDLAMLRVEADELHPIAWGDGKVEVGQWGISPAPSGAPVGIGIVSVGPRKIRHQRGVLGIGVTGDTAGPKISRVFPNSGAQKAGLKDGDIILKVNDKATKTQLDLTGMLSKMRPGDIVRLQIKRGDSEQSIKATLGFPFANPLNRRNLQNRMGGALSTRRAGFESVIQHDTVLRPDECGGPIIDLDGNAFGINIARAGRIESYALPVAIIQPLLADLKSGKLAPPTVEPKSPPAPHLPEKSDNEG